MPQVDRSAPVAALLAVLPLAASACSGPHALERRPEPDVLLQGELPADYSQRTDATSMPDAGDDRPFWESFGDATLQALVEESLERNHDLTASAARVRGALAQSSIARSARALQLDASGQFARNRNVFVGLPIPGSDVVKSTFSQWDAGLNLSWELDLWGRLASQVNAADAEFEATYADLQGARLSVAAQVAAAWFGLREADQQLDLARATLETWTRSLSVVRARNDAGLVGALDVRLAESNVATSRAQLVTAERGRATASRQLEILLGRYPGAELEAAGSFEVALPPVPMGVPAELLERRPDVYAAERRLASAEAAAKAARLDRWPSFALTASAGRTSSELDDLLDGDFTIWALASRVVAPILDGGRRIAAIDESLANLRAAQATFAGTALRSFLEVENALDAERLLGQRITHLEDAVAAAAEATRLADAQYVEGLVAIDLVLDSQRAELAARSTLIAARREVYQARVDLHVALGGSFDPRLVSGAAPELPELTAAEDEPASGAAAGDGGAAQP
ncbi:MAG: efflux transporter outer membrane subunit [Planctomycetota bacterium]